MPSLTHKRGTRAQIDAAAIAGNLKAGELYYITDEARMTAGTATNAHVPLAKQSEVGGSGGTGQQTWVKLTADASNTTTTMSAATGLSFAAAVNTTYKIDVIGTFQSAATTTGIAIALDVPTGSIISGLMFHATSATGGTASVEQIADAVSTGVSSGVRAAATNVPIVASYIVTTAATGGTVQLVFRSEIAGSGVTLKAGLTAMGRQII
jgi:hypothetical protein